LTPPSRLLFFGAGVPRLKCAIFGAQLLGALWVRVGVSWRRGGTKHYIYTCVKVADVGWL